MFFLNNVKLCIFFCNFFCNALKGYIPCRILAMERRTATLLQLGFQLEPAKTQNWNQRMRSTTEPETDTDHHGSRLQTWLSLVQTSHENKEMKQRIMEPWKTLSLQFSIASIRQDLEKMDLKSCIICKSLPIDISNYVENLNSCWPQQCCYTRQQTSCIWLYKKTIYRCSVLGTS